MKANLNQVEKDFIEFISKKRNRPYKEIENIYFTSKNRFEFSSSKYRELNESIHNLFKIIYGDKNEKELIDSYKFHALMHLFRFISYSYPQNQVQGNAKDIFWKLLNFKKEKFQTKIPNTMDSRFFRIAKFLVKKTNKTPVVVDYGCGLGYISFEISTLEKKTKIYLVDIDCLTLEFAEFRFKKHGVDVKVVPVSKKDMYPKLPKHNICIATEVMEHVIQPLKVYQNIRDSLEVGGILYGNFADHKKEMFHVSPNLSKLRCRLNEDFERMEEHSLYRRKIK
jgi:2-polyprenyl-3-methyl-5-hydroxy-6-metoxy-1,4-benzoquinol methylase